MRRRAAGLPGAPEDPQARARRFSLLGLAPSLVLALALAAGSGPPGGAKRPPERARRAADAWEARNADRAKAGLLPRKPPRKARAHRARPRVVPVVAPAPTWLGEPVPPASEFRRGHRGDAVRLEAAGVETDVTLVLRLD